jgi:hypothetical protein
LSNAIKFTQTGSIYINIELVEKSDIEAKIKIEVKDTGVGIPHEKLETIFDKFSQADVSTTRKFGGTGLGLTICKQIVTMMQGTMGVESQEGIGSTFWATTPLTLNQEQPKDTLSTLTSKQTRFKAKKCAIFEDKPLPQQILTEYLRLYGLETEHFETISNRLEDTFQIALINTKLAHAKEFGMRLEEQGVKVIFVGLEKEQQHFEHPLHSHIHYLGRPLHFKSIARLLDQLFEKKQSNDIMTS